MRKKIFITGANGFIGSNLCRYFLAQGFEVYALVRKTSDTHFLDSLPIHLVYGDLREPEGIFPPLDIDYYVHSASIVTDQASADESEAGIHLLTVNFVQRLAELGIRPRRFVYISTTLTLGYLERNISEEKPGKSTDFMPYSQAKKKTEAFLLEKERTEGFPVVILRPG
ncbi:MAG: NAD-dependent epimerase/dehydratase family protein, partial [Acidobacteriota bacterium]